MILCTGFKRVLAPCLENIANQLQLDELGRPLLNEDYAAFGRSLVTASCLW
ncbi:hypothetical protein JCM19235_3495 [Vibrio maritimus]|uniref:Uncharacterized protein n=1 Tax=Vibrio maritimus TaxID=990268 RepID=A0A090S161_9VIBR|nr:hypothetical protein JCM19235_3495 [Vibrio maritimus]